MEYITEHKARYFSSRNGKTPKLIVVHATGGHYQGDILTLTGQTDKQVSAHYYIDQKGHIYYMLDEHKTAWHAGISKWNGLEVKKLGLNPSVNEVSIGIELENSGHEPYTDEQYESLIFVIKDILTRWYIDKENIVGHNQVSPGRKSDPYAYFDWLRVKNNVFGGSYPDWAKDGVEWAKANKIIEKITGQQIQDYRLCVILYRFYVLLNKKK